MDEVFCFFPSGTLAHDCSRKKFWFFFEKRTKKLGSYSVIC